MRQKVMSTMLLREFITRYILLKHYQEGMFPLNYLTIHSYSTAKRIVYIHKLLSSKCKYEHVCLHPSPPTTYYTSPDIHCSEVV